MIAKMGNDVFTFSFTGESPQPVDASTGQAAVEADIGPKAALATEIAPVHVGHSAMCSHATSRSRTLNTRLPTCRQRPQQEWRKRLSWQAA